MSNYFRAVQNYLMRLLFLLGLYTLTRILFLICNRELIGEFEIMNFIGGLRFDVASIAIINLPFTFLYCFPVPLKFTNTLVFRLFFTLINFSAVALNLIDCAYFPFTLRRTTADLFQTQGMANDVWNLLPSFLSDFWYLFTIAFLLFLLIFFVFRTTSIRTDTEKKTSHILYKTFCLLALLVISVIGYRGGLQLRPIGIVTAGSYGNSKQIPLILNTSFTVIRTATQKPTAQLSYFSNEAIDQQFSLNRNFTGTDFTNKNVVIIVLESFGEEYIGKLSGLQTYTPFLDSLIPYCSRPDRGYANGRKSIEAMPAITASIPTLQEAAFVSSAYAGNEINALPAILKKKGYSTSFFHGGQNGTMGFDVYANLAGYDHYFGMNEYPDPEDYDGKWGIPDEPFLNYFGEQLNAFKQPFFTTVFTLSSHHPFTVPAQYRDQLPKGTLPIHQSVAYADLALRKFFDSVKTQPWFSNTIFVITGDHTSLSDNEFYSGAAGQYAVPILFFEPGKTPQNFNGIGQHLDITPTVLSMLGYNGELVFLGNNLSDSSWSRWNLNYSEGQYQFIDQNYLLKFNGDHSTALFNLTADPQLKNDVSKTSDPILLQLENKTKAILQQYTNRQLTNSITRK